MKDSKENIFNELKELDAYYLSQVEDKSTRMPDRYTQTLQKRVEEQISGLRVPESSMDEEDSGSVRNWTMPLVGIAMAAAVALLLIFVPFGQKEITWDDLNAAELSYMLESDLDAFTETEWAEMTGFTDVSVLEPADIDPEYLEEFLLEYYENELNNEDLL